MGTNRSNVFGASRFSGRVPLDRKIVGQILEEGVAQFNIVSRADIVPVSRLGI
jgi:hypothetical protein